MDKCKMVGFPKYLMLLIFVAVQSEDPRKRGPLQYPIDELILKYDDESSGCGGTTCLKRSVSEEGPFWANRGKKDPTYMQDPLYADEPYWVFVRRDDRFQEEPFFMSRGKKDINMKLRDRREYVEDVDSPFFAARGKRIKTKN